MAWKTAIKEIFTIYQNPTNKIDEMENMGVSWWKPWDIGDGTIGQRYGATVKRYDLINNLIKDIIDDPYGRRKIVSLWQETDLHETKGLAPCAFLTMWNIRGKYLDMTLIQRSGDMITASGAGGMNEIQYAVLLMMIARHTGYKAGVFCHFIQNEQIYDRHVDAAKEMLNREKKQQMREYYEETTTEPKMILNPNKTNFYNMTINDFELKNYEPIKPQMKLDLGI
jgi:thymidylate synthase